MNRLEIHDRKIIRARVIYKAMHEARTESAVCFTCGNASEALKRLGLRVVSIGPDQELNTTDWWSVSRIKRTWPNAFDATSGHLPFPLMLELAGLLVEHVGKLDEDEYDVPSGSGETILCLRLAYPNKRFRPVFNCGKGTDRDSRNPLVKHLDLWAYDCFGRLVPNICGP